MSFKLDDVRNIQIKDTEPNQEHSRAVESVEDAIAGDDYRVIHESNAVKTIAVENEIGWITADVIVDSDPRDQLVEQEQPKMTFESQGEQV